MEFFADLILSNLVFIYFVAWLTVAPSLPSPLYLFYFITAIYYVFLAVFALVYPQYWLYCIIGMCGGIFGKLIPIWLILRNSGSVKLSRTVAFSVAFLTIYLVWLRIRNTNIGAVYQKMINKTIDIPITIGNLPRIIGILLGIAP